jgi:hypothetical protein
MAELRAVDGADEADDTQSFDDFWAEVQAETTAKTEVICGVEVLVPSDLPLGFSIRLNELQESESDEDVRELVALLFGEGALEDWMDAGMTGRQFQTVLAWGVARAQGQAITFRQAYDIVSAAEEGKAPVPNRAARRAAVRQRSAATGGRSKRTSSASTGSARKTSRG